MICGSDRIVQCALRRIRSRKADDRVTVESSIRTAHQSFSAASRIVPPPHWDWRRSHSPERGNRKVDRSGQMALRARQGFVASEATRRASNVAADAPLEVASASKPSPGKEPSRNAIPGMGCRKAPGR